MPVKLLKDLFALSNNQDGIKILNNVVIAALHMACMFKGTAERAERLVNLFVPSSTFPVFTVIEFRPFQIYHPRQSNGIHPIHCLLRYTDDNTRDGQFMLNNEEADFLHHIIRMPEIQKIRHALYGALLFSPLYLLTHRKLTGNAWDQEKMHVLTLI